MDLDGMCKELCEVERDRMTAAEIGLDEVLTIMDRHGLTQHDAFYRAVRTISGTLHRALTYADGHHLRHERLLRIRDVLTDAMPMTDADLGVQ